jgi:hypothetical protein
MTDFAKVICDNCKGTGIEPKSFNESCKKCSGIKELDWIQNITGVEISRLDKSILFVIKALNILAEKGLVTNGNMAISSEALEMIKDFKPTKEEMETAVAILKKEGHIA